MKEVNATTIEEKNELNGKKFEIVDQEIEIEIKKTG
jgi:hypothetical protein